VGPANKGHDTPREQGARHAGRMRPMISETELVGLYRSADILFLPVINATANNAILKALACGTPVISTLVGGVPDYVNDESGWLLPVGDVVGHVDLIASLHGTCSC
jgi:glycosyltransferase involved in cell wall biosynthesis